MRYLIYILCVSFLFSGCEKDETLTADQQLAKDIEIIEKYLKDNNLTAQKTASGLHYIIKDPGTGSSPTGNSQVKIKYKGYFVNNEVFNKTSGNEVFIDFLYKFIDGWKEGIPLFKKGGKGTLLIPSYLGYGSSSISNVPKNSVLIFDIELVDFTQ